MSNEIEKTEVKSVTIVDTTIPILEYKGHRVITLAMVDKLHHRPEGTAGRNFRENKEKFAEGKHFFNLEFQEVKSLDEFRRAGIVANSQGLTVVTDRGYSMLVKSFNDDFAWEVQDQLVDSYFDTKKPMSTAEFLVQQSKLILEHENKIKRLEQRQSNTEIHVAENKHEIELAHQKAEMAFEAASAAMRHKYGESDYFTVVGFCSKHKIKLQGEDAKIHGLHATQTSRSMDKEIVKIPDDRWGKVNTYHISVLEKVFADKL